MEPSNDTQVFYAMLLTESRKRCERKIARHIIVLVFLAITFCCRFSASQELPGGVWSPKTSLAVVEFDNKSGGITIVVKIDGVDRKLLLDTGFTRTTLDVSLLTGYAPFKSDEKALAEPYPIERRFLQGDVVNGSEIKHELRHYQCPSMSIAGVELKTDIGVDGGSVIDTPFQKAIATGFVGILGMDQLCAFGLHIDYDNRKIVLFENVDKSGTPPGVVHKLVYKANCPTVVVAIAGKDFYATIDTGNVSDELAMKESYFKLLLKLASIQDCDIRRVNCAIFPSPNENVILDQKLEWGDNVYQPVNVCPNAKWNMLGARFLMRHRLTFDFTNNVIYVADGAHRNSTYHNDFDGIVLSCETDGRRGLKVLSIAPSSIAEKAGIQSGDYLLSIGNTEVSFNMLSEVCRVVCVDRNKDLEVKLQRDDRILTLILPGNKAGRHRSVESK